MKARTKHQKKIVALSGKVKKLTKAQIRYCEVHAFDHKAFRNKSGTTCMECGHTFDLKVDFTLLVNSMETHCKCPNCGMMLKYVNTQIRKTREVGYMNLVSTIREYMVVRTVEMYQNYTKYEKAKYEYHEVVRHFIDVNGKATTMATLGSRNYYSIGFSWGEMSIRNFHYIYDVNCRCEYPKIKVFDIVRRNGFTGDFHSFSPYTLITKLLSDNKFETVFKVLGPKVANHYLRYGNYWLKKRWSQLRICIRNNYAISDINMWDDYIDFLEHEKMSLSDVNLICPIDLKHEHDVLMNKIKAEEEIKRAAQNELERKQQALDNKEAMKNFKARVRKLKDIKITNGEIEIIPLTTVTQHKKEGDALNHCVYSSNYWKKLDSFIFSARLNNESIETLEVSLKDFELLQCRGYNNHDSKWHKEIVELYNKNREIIMKAYDAGRFHRKVQTHQG